MEIRRALFGGGRDKYLSGREVLGRGRKGRLRGIREIRVWRDKPLIQPHH